MIGVMLRFVGAVLLVNGMGGLDRVDGRSMAVMKFMVGGLALVASLIQLARAETPADFFGIAAFLLFTFIDRAGLTRLYFAAINRQSGRRQWNNHRSRHLRHRTIPSYSPRK